jgi:hypothetical protein
VPAGFSPTNRCPRADDGAAAHWCSRWCRVPRAVRIRKEPPDREPLREAFRAQPSLCPIVGHRVAQRGGHGPERVREPIAGTPRISPLTLCQENPARRPFHQDAAGRAIPYPLMRSPSQWLCRVLVATSAGCSAIGVMWGSGPVDPSPATEAGAPDTARPTVRCAEFRVAAHPAPQR